MAVSVTDSEQQGVQCVLEATCVLQLWNTWLLQGADVVSFLGFFVFFYVAF